MKNSDITQWYLSNFDVFEASLNGDKQADFHTLRKQALAKFSDLGFPTPKDEEWKYTNIAPILKHKFKLSGDSHTVSPDIIKPFLFEGLDEFILVFVNGIFKPELSRQAAKDDGVIVESLKNARDRHADLLAKHLGQYIDFDSETFTAFNTAFVDDGAFVYIPKNTVLPEVVHIINLTDVADDSAIIHPRNLIVLEEGAEAEVVESFHALTENIYFNNLVTEVFVGKNAKLEHVKLQEESVSGYHISNSQVCQKRDSNYTTINIDLGGLLVRNNLNISLEGENCESHLYGYYMGFEEQHIDNHTFIDHAEPNCFSNELYKGILDDKAQGVFNGKILVRQDAQKTNALQSNKTLLLTNDASVYAKPQLEIFADDVKCTHGATIGQLDDEALFYLRARGIGEDMAGAMLRHAFVADVLDNVKIDSIRQKLDHDIIEKFTVKGR